MATAQPLTDDRGDHVTFSYRAAALGAGLSAAALALCLTGCGPTPTHAATQLACASPKAPLALAVGARANSPTPLLSQVSRLIDGTANASLPITLIRLDGTPKVVFNQPFTSSAGNSQARHSDLVTYLNGMNAVFRNAIRAKVPGADVLTALTLAAQATRPGDNIVIMDSGLQTTTPLEFQHNDLLQANPGDVVRFLRKQNLLPDLQGRRIVLVSFGQTARPQHPLGLDLQRDVIGIWEQIARAGRAACVWADTYPNTGTALTRTPTVPVVPLPAPPRMHPCGTTILNASNHVNFVPNKAVFIDPSGARATLRQLADQIRNGTQTVKLIGSTATYGSPASRVTLSGQRADAVRRMLVSLGVAASRITTKGDGSNMPGRVSDVGPNGGLLPGPAAEDREVVAKLTCHG